jgi:hypothetical protein
LIDHKLILIGIRFCVAARNLRYAGEGELVFGSPSMLEYCQSMV